MTLDKPEELLEVNTDNISIARREVMKNVKNVVFDTLYSYADKIQDEELKKKYRYQISNFAKARFDINSLSTFPYSNRLIQKDGKFIVFSEISVDFKTIADAFSDEAMKEFEAIFSEAKEAFLETKKLVTAITENALYTDSTKPYLEK